MTKNTVWEEVAHDLGYIDSRALENAMVNQKEYSKALRRQIVNEIEIETDMYEGYIKDGIDIAKRIILNGMHE